MSDWRKEGQQRLKDKNSGTTLSIPEGEHSIRLMPNKKDILPGGKMNPKGCENPPFLEFRLHEKVGPDEKSFRCGKDTNGRGKCWYCDVKLPEIEKSGKSSLRKMAANSIPRDKFVVIASLMDPKTEKLGKPKPWWISTGSGLPGRQGQSLAFKVHKRIMSRNKDVVDPKKGYNLFLEKTGSGIKTRYPQLEVEENMSIVPSSILALVPDLEESVFQYDSEVQKAIYLGKPLPDRNAPKDDDEEDEDESDEESDDVEESEEESEDENDSEESDEDDSEEESEDEEESSEDEEESDEESEDDDEDKESEDETEDEDESEDASDDDVEEEEDEEEEKPKPATKKTGKATTKTVTKKPATSKKPVTTKKPATTKKK